MDIRPEEQYKQAKEIARQVMLLARNTVLVNLRFMDMALARLECADLLGYPLATDGERLYYSPLPILLEYKEEQNRPARNYMHATLHCVFHHPFIGTLIDRELWDLSCDIAVENSITDLSVPSLFCRREALQKEELSRLKTKVKYMTAEIIYRYFLDNRPSENEILRLRRFFQADSHDLWYLTGEASGTDGRSDGRDNADDRSDQTDGRDNADDHSDQTDGRNNADDRSDQTDGNGNVRSDRTETERASADREELKKEWKDISERMQQEMEHFVKLRGDTSGDLIQNLMEVTREKYDYSSFLKKFATMHEAMKINDEEFDYVFYTYGLRLYKKMPLIEPLEYKDVKRVKELVIAIDTSGSVCGEEVQSFLQKTYNILKNEESFFAKFTLYIIQCDAEITEAVKITTQKEFDDYLATMTLKGFGGTDFRPVFDYVNRLIEKKEFTNLKGMIYFTDGYGVFPEHKPPYETAFVFVEDGYETPKVPPWAIKLVLHKDQI